MDPSIRNGIVTFLFAVLLLALVGCDRSRADRVYGKRNTQAYAAVKMHELQTLEILNSGRFPALGMSSKAWMRLDENLFGLLYADAIGTNQTSLEGSHDPWGHFFLLSVDIDNDGKTEVGGRTLLKRIVVWSCGANGRNDFGSNDDVVSWESYRTCMERLRREHRRIDD